MADLFARSASDIVKEAVEKHKPVAIYAGFSGGDDSLALCHWMMTNVPGSQLFHIDTGIGIQRTRDFIKETAKRYDWPLVVISAKEDCGQDYDWIVRKWGFPGPRGHRLVYNRLKERGVALLVRRAKAARYDRVLLATGIREDESIVRAGYKDREINRTGAQLWVNPIYWWSKSERDDYLRDYQIQRNPVSRALGISGECLCGAFAQPGELERVRAIDPDVAARIDRLAVEVRDKFPWGWEERPPKAAEETQARQQRIGMLCIGCEKSVIVQEELKLHADI